MTDETYYSAEDTISLLDHFKMDHTYPCLATNRWVTSIMVLFRPQIEELIRERERVITAWQEEHPDRDVYEDRELEVTSETAIDVPKQLSAVRQAILSHGKAA